MGIQKSSVELPEFWRELVAVTLCFIESPCLTQCHSCDTKSRAYLSRKTIRSGVLPPVPYRAVRWG